MWRRSLLTVTVVCGVLTLPFSLAEVQSRYTSHASAEKDLHWPATFEMYKTKLHDDDFGRYTQRSIARVIATVMSALSTGSLYTSVLNLGFQWVAIVFSMLALTTWPRLQSSTKYTTLGWLALFMSPIVCTIIPMKIFVPWDIIEPTIDAYTHDAIEYSGATRLFTQCSRLQHTYIPAYRNIE